MTADKQLSHQDANPSDAFIAEKVHHVSTKGASTFRTNHSVHHVSDILRVMCARLLTLDNSYYFVGL